MLELKTLLSKHHSILNQNINYIVFAFNEYLFLIIAYLLGSVAFGVIITKFLGLGDITKQGSGNIGATNVVRVAGKKVGGLVFALDLLKGFLPAFIYKMYFFEADSNSTPHYAIYLIAMASVLGHIFPIWRKFKGGKGVATGLGAILALKPVIFLLTIFIWLLTYKTTRISSLSALASFGIIPFLSFGIYQNNFYLLFFLISLSLIIYFKHISNIKRLLNGEEKPFTKT